MSRGQRIGLVALAVVVLIVGGVGVALLVTRDDDEQTQTTTTSKSAVTTTIPTTIPTTTSVAPSSTAPPTTAATVGCSVPGAGTAQQVGAGTSGTGILKVMEVHPAGAQAAGGPGGVPACAEQVVFTFQGGETGEGMPGYTVSYLTEPPRFQPSDNPAVIEGSAFLLVRFEPAQAHSDTGLNTLETPIPLLPTDTSWVKEVMVLQDFEGVLWVVIGLDGTHPFTVAKPGIAPQYWISIGSA